MCYQLLTFTLLFSGSITPVIIQVRDSESHPLTFFFTEKKLSADESLFRSISRLIRSRFHHESPVAGVSGLSFSGVSDSVLISTFEIITDLRSVLTELQTQRGRSPVVLVVDSGLPWPWIWTQVSSGPGCGLRCRPEFGSSEQTGCCSSCGVY